MGLKKSKSQRKLAKTSWKRPINTSKVIVKRNAKRNKAMAKGTLFAETAAAEVAKTILHDDSDKNNQGAAKEAAKEAAKSIRKESSALKDPTALPSHPIPNHSSLIRNKMKRGELYARYLREKKAYKRQIRVQRAKLLAQNKTLAPPKTPRTQENTRETEVTMVRPFDEEVNADEAQDEFASYFSNEKKPKIMLTTIPKSNHQLQVFLGDLMLFFPQAYYYPRRHFGMKQILSYATNENFTHLIVASQKSKCVNGLLITHLPSGPSAFYKISNYMPSCLIPDVGTKTGHVPELVLNGFGTRLGHRVGRFLGSLFPHGAEFEGRQVATFHNQRDYIFVRHHRYIFEEDKKKVINPQTNKPRTKARLQELGPRFTMKLRWLQEGTFDGQFGEYEWFHKRKEMDTTRLKFHL